jgi:GNAT superfamily N-acetyltransferase
VYDASCTWNEEEKQVEMFDEGSRYLIAFVDSEPVGFLHFKFEQQYDEFVLFIFTVQIDPRLQGRRLGKHLVNTAEFIGLNQRVNAIMTMVFRANPQGLEFFKHLKYRVHYTSPSELEPDLREKHVYEVLWKPLVRGA